MWNSMEENKQLEKLITKLKTMNRYSRLKEEHMLMLCWTVLKPSKPENWNMHLYDPTPLDQASEHSSDNMIEFTFPKKPADTQVIVQFFPHATNDSEGIRCWLDANNIDEGELPDNLIAEGRFKVFSKKRKAEVTNEV